MTSKVIQGHIRPLLCQNLFTTFFYGLILIKKFMNANIMKTQFFFYKIIYDLKYHFYVIYFFTLRISNQITNLTYVLMDNFCPCLICNQAALRNQAHFQILLFLFKKVRITTCNNLTFLFSALFQFYGLNDY